MNEADTETAAVKLDPPSMAYRCPHCHDEHPQPEVENNPSSDRWFTCPACGYKWSVSPIADS